MSPPPHPPEERGGVLLRYGAPDADGGAREALAFVPAEVALRLTDLAAFTEVPGAPPPARGIALVDGEVVTILAVGLGEPARTKTAYRSGEDWPVPGADRAILCSVGAQRVALIGGVVVATGVFDACGEDAVTFRGERVPTLDVRALHAQAEKAIWAQRASSSRPKPRGQSAPPTPLGLSPGGPLLRPPPLPFASRAAEEVQEARPPSSRTTSDPSDAPTRRAGLSPTRGEDDERGER
jgi:hypothetical protein